MSSFSVITPTHRELELDHQDRSGGDEHCDQSTLKSNFQASVVEVETGDPVTWNGTEDPANPQNWTTRRKWMITLLCCVLTINVTFASSAPTSATSAIADEFGVSAEISNLITALFLAGYVVGPLFWGPGSEIYGRKTVFMLTMTAYTLLHLGQSLSQNVTTLLITRFLGGVFAIAPVTNCGGVIADIWSAAGRGPAMSLFMTSIFLGPATGPVVGGFIVESYLGWRWVFWVMMIFAGFCTTIMFIALPETYAPVLLQRKAQNLRKADPIANKAAYATHERQDQSLKGLLRRTVFRSFHMLAVEPILVLITLYLSIVYGILYALFEAIPIIFVEKRGFSIVQNSLVFVGIGIGSIIGCIINLIVGSGYWKLEAKWRGFPPPENRLSGSMIGAPCFVIGIFWLGWSGQYPSVPWYVPALSTVVIGMSINLVFISFFTYIVDTYLTHSATAFAGHTMFRSAVAAGFPMFIVQMFDSMGSNWSSTLLGLVALVLTPAPFLFYKYGPRIRAKSKFAPCADLHITGKIEAEEHARTV